MFFAVELAQKTAQLKAALADVFVERQGRHPVRTRLAAGLLATAKHRALNHVVVGLPEVHACRNEWPGERVVIGGH